MNGKLLPWKDALIHVSAHALHYGSGVFEGIRCYETTRGPAVFCLHEHLKRLFASASIFNMKLPYSLGQIEKAVVETIRKNQFTRCYIRPIAYYGSHTLTLHPRQSPVDVAILAWPWETYIGASELEHGARVTISSRTKYHSKMIPTTAKTCGPYVNSILGIQEAVAKGYHEAILLDIHGKIAEGTGENLFIIHKNTVITNDEKSSILLGITRNSVLQIAEDLGYPVKIRALSVKDLLKANEAFFTGTAAEVTPIREVDGNKIGTGKRGPITQKIQELFFSITKGEAPAYKKWLSFI